MIGRRDGEIAWRCRREAKCIGGFRIYGRLVIAGAALAAFGGFLASMASGAEFSCRDRILVDYSQALKRMPSDRLPGPGGLTFGPRDLDLKPGRSILVEREPITYTLALDRPISANGRVVRSAGLGWVMTLRLDSVDHFGRPMRISGERRWRVRRLRYPERQFSVRAGSGIYRASLTIRKRGGPTLASFRQYIRILPLREKLGVKISGDNAVEPGESVVARIENRGTAEASLPSGSGLTVERFEDGLWGEVAAEEPSSTAFELPEFLPGGRASQCSYLTIPSDSAPGALRLSAVVQTGSGKPRRVFERFAVL